MFALFANVGFVPTMAFAVIFSIVSFIVTLSSLKVAALVAERRTLRPLGKQSPHLLSPTYA